MGGGLDCPFKMGDEEVTELVALKNRAI